MRVAFPMKDYQPLIFFYFLEAYSFLSPGYTFENTAMVKQLYRSFNEKNQRKPRLAVSRKI